jgi:hypothetical protein
VSEWKVPREWRASRRPTRRMVLQTRPSKRRVPSMPKVPEAATSCTYPTCDCRLEKTKKYECPRGLPRSCSYPDCKCIVQTSTSQPVPVCPLGLLRQEEKS